MTITARPSTAQINTALTCPAWCTEIADHGSGVPSRPAVWERSHWAHISTFASGVSRTDTDISVAISQYAGTDETEVTVLPPVVWVFELDSDTPLTPIAARKLAAALLNAADMAESDIPTAAIPVQRVETVGGAR